MQLNCFLLTVQINHCYIQCYWIVVFFLVECILFRKILVVINLIIEFINKVRVLPLSNNPDSKTIFTWTTYLFTIYFLWPSSPNWKSELDIYNCMYKCLLWKPSCSMYASAVCCPFLQITNFRNSKI